VSYVGRFAPSPTGPLHLGSLTTAVASFLHARQHGGEWLVRIEDIDPPREIAGSADDILRTLEAFGLDWDRTVRFQSTRLEAYWATAERLLDAGLAFRCDCSRKDVIRSAQGARRYPGTCRDRALRSDDTAIRVRVEPGELQFLDELQGLVVRDPSRTDGDYVIYRRDGLPAYHLAVVQDDNDQGVNVIVRGVDLLEPTALHWHLQELLRITHPRYSHIPVLVNSAGQKLSKQTGAPPARPRERSLLAATALGCLGLTVPADLRGAPPGALWTWAEANWDVTELKGVQSIHIP
jgi:glutamyl-Q tRNA(Asp) synthetase